MDKELSAWILFIRNGVNQVRRLIDVENWRHCQGELNPADLPTRGVSEKKLVDNELWWEGPAFLKDNILLTSTFETGSEIEIDDVKKNCRKGVRKNPTRSHALVT